MAAWTKKLLSLTGAAKDKALQQLRRYDSWANINSGINTARDKSAFTLPFNYSLITQQQLEDLYHNDDVANRIITALPDEAFRERWTIINKKPDPDARESVQEQVNELDMFLEKNGAREKLREAAVWGRLFGLGAVLVGYNDGRPPWEPVDWKNLKSIDYLTVLDKRDLTPWRWYADPQQPRFGDVAIYLVQPVGVFVGAPYDLTATNQIFLCHEERMLRFEGELTSKRRRLANQGSDFSVLQRCFRALQLTNDNWQSAAVLLSDASQGVFKIKGLVDMIAQQPDVMNKRMVDIDFMRSTVRALVLDAEAESFERVPSHFQGIPQMLEQTWKRLAAAARMPLTVLMGMSPGGMNATGESDIRWWYDQVKSFQEQAVRPNLELLMRAYAIGQGWEDTEHWGAVFAPLNQLTLKEEAEVRFQMAQADAQNITNGVYTPEEAALSRYGGNKFSVDTQIDIESRQRILKMSIEKDEIEAEAELERAGEEPPPKMPGSVAAEPTDPKSTPDPKPPGVPID